jgi:nicotinamide-nucleotide adenylyltransferase/phosphinothricin biosynthesis protein PhpF
MTTPIDQPVLARGPLAVSDVHPVGVIHGRFQPLHLGHLEYLLAGADRCDVLVVGITNPDPWTVRQEAADPARSLGSANPFTYYDRYVMVTESLVGAGVGRERLRVVPFPHSFPERLAHYAPRDAVYLLTVYDDWGRDKLARLGALGLRTEVMWERTDKPVNGTRVRSAIHAGQPWEHLVPAPVVDVVRSAVSP